MPTNKLQIQTIQQNQNNKYVTINYALNVLEALSIGVVEKILTDTTGETFTAGQLFIIAGNSTGTLASQNTDLAYHDGTSLGFFPAQTGHKLYNKEDGNEYRFDGTSWIVIV